MAARSREHTLGKGLMQTIFVLSNGLQSSLRYQTPPAQQQDAALLPQPV